MEGALFTTPEKFLLSPFWDNPLVKRNNRVIKSTSFPSLANCISTVADFFKTGENKMLTYIEFIEKYNTRGFTQEQYIDIWYIITTARQSLGIREENILPKADPMQPLLINLATMTKKGCSVYYKLLTQKQIMNSKIYIRQIKWHDNLNSVFSVDFWKNVWLSISQIKYENKIKWLQYNIARSCLMTNTKVSKFKAEVSPLCTYCRNHPEQILHLFWVCHNVWNFWNEVHNFFIQMNILIPLIRHKILFGVHDKKPDSISNYIILTAKQYIWHNKFVNQGPSFPLQLSKTH